jgi:Na+(H+)/acetate symporter ActP
MILLLLIFILLVLIYIVRISNNNDIIKNNAKTVEQMQIIKAEKKKQHLTKVSKALTAISIISLIVFILMDFTSIDYIVMDYFATDFVTEQEFDRLLYFIPAYVMITNLIYTQVNIGDFLLKFFKTQEEEMDIKINKDAIMGLLYKKKPVTEEEQKNSEK